MKKREETLNSPLKKEKKSIGRLFMDISNIICYITVLLFMLVYL